MRREMIQQRADVFRPVAQRTDHHADDVQAEVQILPEAAALRHLPQVPIRARDESRVDFDGDRLADGHDLLLLDHAQQFGLQIERDFADLVEEQRAGVGGADQAQHALLGAGERAADVSEELALEERFAKCPRS